MKSSGKQAAQNFRFQYFCFFHENTNTGHIRRHSCVHELTHQISFAVSLNSPCAMSPRATNATVNIYYLLNHFPHIRMLNKQCVKRTAYSFFKAASPTSSASRKKTESCRRSFVRTRRGRPPKRDQTAKCAATHLPLFSSINVHMDLR